MDNPSRSSRAFWLTVLCLTVIVNLLMLRLTYVRQIELGSDLTRSAWSGVLLLCFLLAAICLWSIFRIVRSRDEFFTRRLERVQVAGLAGRLLGTVIFALVVFLIPYLKFKYQIGQEVRDPVYDPVLLRLAYYWLCWWLMLLGMVALKVALQTTWFGGFVSALILLGVVYEIMFRFNTVTDYPFSLGWSEGSRYYYASLFFSERTYGETFPLSTLHPSRYLLQSFPFLFPSLGLFAHRFWQFLLWVGLAAGTSVAFSHRVFSRHESALRWLTAGWLFLFLLRVGVYYHLEVMVILPLLFVNIKKPWQSLVAVIVASAWAGISRVNWFPMPAMLAIAIYLLETPVKGNASDKTALRQLTGYLLQPALWGVIGVGSALLAQFVYISLSGNSQNAEAFTSSFTSDLLWYRLWPNENFPIGIIPAILIISGPFIMTIIFGARAWRSLHGLRWLGLIAMLLVLFAGSTVVSTKIGGGGDLHNMDAYTVLVALVGLYFFAGQVKAETGDPLPAVRVVPVSVVAVILPLLVLIPALSPYPRYDAGRNADAHQQLISVINQAGQQGPVLLINERQIIALDEVNVPLIYDYEVVTLMEMAMSGNQPYLNKFYAELAEQRFAVIIATRQNTVIKLEGVFAEENNVWNTYVSPYILCNYESQQTIEADGSRIEVYMPRTQPLACPSGNIMQSIIGKDDYD